MFVGFVFIFKFVQFFMLYSKLKKWKEIDIEVCETSIRKEKEMALYTNSMYRYYPYICYGYIVNDKKFTSNIISMDVNREWSYFEDKTISFLEPLKNIKTAYINPQKVDESVIFNYPLSKTISHNISLLIVGVFLVFVGYLLPNI